jgi:hypothetical protein
VNCKLVEVLLQAGTPASAESERQLAEMLLGLRDLLAPAVGRYAPLLPPDAAMAEVLPDLVAGWRDGRLHWFTLRYLKRAAAIRAGQLRRDGARHRPFEAEPAAERPPDLDALDGEPAERRVSRLYREFLAGLGREERRLLILARRAGKGAAGGHRQGWQKAVAEQLGRPPCWVTRRLDALFPRLAALLGRADLKQRKRRRAAG